MPPAPFITQQFPARSPDFNAAFAEQYVALRKKEERLYSDEQVKQLPAIEANHPHYAEWRAREQSMKKLVKYIRRMKRPLNILEVGCGNGWLAHKIAQVPGTTVTGFDINQVELQQAMRVFGYKHNLRFRTSSPFSFRNNEQPYDLVIFAASIQYFPSLDAIISDALNQLKVGGSIHIIDTHFYDPSELVAARQRTIDHFTALGFPAMADHYFHHSLVTLSKFNYGILYNPHSWRNRLLGSRGRNPFYWITIKKY